MVTGELWPLFERPFSIGFPAASVDQLTEGLMCVAAAGCLAACRRPSYPALPHPHYSWLGRRGCRSAGPCETDGRALPRFELRLVHQERIWQADLTMRVLSSALQDNRRETFHGLVRSRLLNCSQSERPRRSTLAAPATALHNA